MPIDELAALGASLCFAVAGLLAVEPSRVLGAIRFNRIRMLVISVLLLTVSWFSGGIDTLSMDVLPVLVISGLVGIFLGDTFLFAGLRRVGPRRNAVMFALNAPLTAIAGMSLSGRGAVLSCVSRMSFRDEWRDDRDCLWPASLSIQSLGSCPWVTASGTSFWVLSRRRASGGHFVIEAPDGAGGGSGRRVCSARRHCSTGVCSSFTDGPREGLQKIIQPGLGRSS